MIPAPLHIYTAIVIIPQRSNAEPRTAFHVSSPQDPTFPTHPACSTDQGKNRPCKRIPSNGSSRPGQEAPGDVGGGPGCSLMMSEVCRGISSPSSGKRVSTFPFPHRCTRAPHPSCSVQDLFLIVDGFGPADGHRQRWCGALASPVLGVTPQDRVALSGAGQRDAVG